MKLTCPHQPTLTLLATHTRPHYISQSYLLHQAAPDTGGSKLTHDLKSSWLMYRIWSIGHFGLPDSGHNNYP